MRFAVAALISIAVCVQPARAQDTGAATRAATTVADSWLALADAGNYAQSWKQGAALFRAAVSQEQWTEALRSARAPFGALKSRTLKSAQYTRTLPGVPEGEYVVIQYQTEFAGRPATETVVPMREDDGSWRVSGYVIR